VKALALLLLVALPASLQAQDHDQHQGHETPAEVMQEGEVGDAPAPAPPQDHAADAIFGPEKMARARKVLAYEVGGMGYSLVMVDLAEIGFHKGRETYRFEGEASTGGNINRAVLKFEGEGVFRDGLEDLELQALYSRAIAPYWNLRAGIRHDIEPSPSRTHLAIGVGGLAPYWFHLDGSAFLSAKGDVRARIEASYDQRITNAFILQPRIEANLSLQDIPALGVGAGLSDFEAGLRLRYEWKQEFAPYLGIEWRRKTGATARFARAAGEEAGRLSFVAGIRVWF
jgi:copper resistance protein B